MSVEIILKNSSVEDKRPTPSQLTEGEISLNYNGAGAFLCCEDKDGNIQQLGGIKIATVAPSSPVKQTLWFNPDTDNLYVYDGTTWHRVGGGGSSGGGGGITTLIAQDGLDEFIASGIATLNIDLAGGDDGLEFDVGKLKASIASASTFGSVKIGAGINTATDGTISVTPSDALVYRGSVDLSLAPGGQILPGAPNTGDFYITTTQVASVLAGWTGVGGDSSNPGDLIVWNGGSWDLLATGSEPVALNDLSDVTVTGATEASLLNLNSSGEWVHTLDVDGGEDYGQ